MDHPGDLVESFAVDRQTGMGGLDHLIGDFGQRGIFLDRDDIGARHHHIARADIAQAKDVADHGAFAGVDLNCALIALVDQFFNRVAGRLAAITAQTNSAGETPQAGY